MYVVFERNVRKLLVWAFSGNEWIFGLSFLLVVLTLTARFGNVFCGWICQTPAIHELIYLRRFTHRLPKKFDGLMKKLRYLVLAVFLVVLFLTRESVFSLIFRIGNHLGLKIFLAGRSITFASRCNGCGKAERSCRMGALSCPSPRSNKPGEFIRMDCIECGACIGACPKNAVIRN
jgi:polyferredoxin